ncbi:hypothetical protein BC343_03050 [Mucilaginibacter pedocola]|uniref:histidine kinase n=1 Tax=Mucilaginibacter pedocola TaxID=1792845 RepID=A0A1S9PMZ2_9SPHI|nr:hypothetical protein BC343_03050 [Mucilaginibacter pedocola]
MNLIQGHLENVISKLMDSEERLKQAIETGHMGTWSINPETYEVTISGFIKEMFGFPLDENVSMEKIMNAIHPEYHQMLTTVLSNAIAKGESSDTEYSITNQQTGETKWVRATGRVFSTADGKPMEYSGLFMDITERKLDDLRKNDFIGMVSHELKTPLTTLSAYIQMLRGRAQNNADDFTNNALDKVGAQVKKMTGMINAFLNVSRLDSGKIQLEKQEFVLNLLLEEMIQEARVTTAHHTITLLPGEQISIVADRDKIGSVVSNLLSNSIKYSPRGNIIEVECKTEGRKVVVSVRDEGMGIKPEHLDRLFDRFYRVETKHTQHISGFGIGLYLSGEIIQRHDGKIWAESEIGKGSTFYFSLPLE